MIFVHNRELERPTVVCDTDEYVILKIGEYEEMKEYYKITRKALKNINYKDLNKSLNKMGLPELDKPIERSIELIELPLDQELVDNVFYNTGYLKTYLDRTDVDNVVRVNFEPID